MDSSLWTRRVLTGLVVCVALTFAATIPAWAGEDETSDKDGHARMHVVVKKGDQDGKVQVLELKDGKWVGSDGPVHDRPGRVEHYGHVHNAHGQVEHDVVVRRMAAAKAAPARARNPMSTVMRWLMTDGLSGDMPNDPVKAWFDGGADVPMAGLRDALKADGWTSRSLQHWFIQHVMGAMAAMHAPQAQRPMHARGPARGHWFEVGRGHGRCNSGGCDSGRGERRFHDRNGCDCGHGRGARHDRRGGCDSRNSRGSCHGDCGSCNKRGSCRNDCGSCDKRRSCHGDCGSCDKRSSRRGDCGSCDKQGARKGRCGSGPKGPARRQAYMLWNDGSGWKHRQVDGQGPLGHSGNRHGRPGGMVFHGQGGEAMPELHRILEKLISGGQPASGTGHHEIKGLELLPAELLEHVPPELLEHVSPGMIEGVLKELHGLGLGELLPPAKSGRGCQDCPKKDSCKGGACDEAKPKKAASCCGTCGGKDCADCPKAKDGSCEGDCKDCPNREKAAAGK